MKGKIRPRRFGAIAVLALAVAAGGCAARSTETPVQRAELSPTLNPFVHFEDGAVAFVGVDGRAAQYVKDDKVFPLGFAIANRTKGTLSLSRESFVLEDGAGGRWPPVSYAEFASESSRARTDLRLSDSFREMMQLRFETLAFAPWPLYPPPGGSSTTRERIELARAQYTVSILYFPVPAGGIHAKPFTLLVRPKGAGDPLVVKFRLR